MRGHCGLGRDAVYTRPAATRPWLALRPHIPAEPRASQLNPAHPAENHTAWPALGLQGFQISLSSLRQGPRT